jgi:hypothetical protein
MPNEHQQQPDDEAQAAGHIQPVSIAHDNVAGIRLLKYPRFKQMQLQFVREVPTEVVEQLSRHGWTHRPNEGVYTKQFDDRGQATAIVEARRFYSQLRETLGTGRDDTPSF